MMKTLLSFSVSALLSVSAFAQGIYAQGVFIGMGPAAGMAPPAISIVSVTTNYLAATGTSLTTTIPATAAGNLLLIVTASYHGHVTSFQTNSVSATFQITTNQTIGAGGTFSFVEGDYCKNVGAGVTTVTIGVTADGSNTGFMTVTIFEISGLSTTAPYTATERMASTAGGTSSVSTQDTGGQINNGTAASIFFAACISDGTSIITTINASGTDGTWIEPNNTRNDGSISFNFSTVYQIVASSSARKEVWNRVNNATSTSAIEFILH